MEQFKPGKTISFRLPSDTPDEVIAYLSKRKTALGRKFSSEIAPLFVETIMKKVNTSTTEDAVSIALPDGLSKEQKDWVNHPQTKALLTQLLYQIVSKPNAGVDFHAAPVVENKETTPTFQTNETIQRFAQKNFLDFDEDDD